jgi:hypothetical protein
MPISVIYPWVIFFLLPTIAVFAMDGGGNRPRTSIEPFDVALFFPANLSAVLTRTAEAFSVPLAGMLNLMLFFSSILASTTYISGPGGAKIEPLIAYFLNYGDSGINKTGLSKIFEYLLHEVTTVLRKFSLHTSMLFEKGFSIHRLDLPIRDCTATPAAAIQKQSKNRVCVRFDDEWGVRARALANGTGGCGMENGAQQQLQLFNGPNTIINELKAGVEEAQMPRWVCSSNIQPPLFQNDLGKESVLFALGLTTRHFLAFLEPNFDSEHKREPLSDNEQQIGLFLAAVAARSCVFSGEWKERENASDIEDAFRGNGPSELIAAESVELEYLKNSFSPTAFGDLASMEIQKWHDAAVINERNLSECTKAQNSGKVPAGRFLLQISPDPPDDDGISPKLPFAFSAAGLMHMRMLRAEPGSLQESAVENHLRICDKRMQSKDSVTKIIDGKGAGQFLRLVGLM